MWDLFYIFGRRDALLYIGKYKGNVKDRIKQHLVKSNISTSSKIKEVSIYLSKAKSLTLKYCAIAINKNQLATIEGVLIDYALKQNASKYSAIWNKRVD